MKASELWCALNQCRAEADQAWRKEIDRLGVLGLRVIGVVALVTPPVFMVLSPFFGPIPHTHATGVEHLQYDLIVMALGAIALGLSAVRRLAAWSRQIGATFGLLIAGCLIWSALLMTGEVPGAAYAVTGQVSMVLLVGVLAMPLHAWQTFVWGLSIQTAYWAINEYALAAGVLDPALAHVCGLFLFIMTILTTGLTTVVYGQRVRTFRAHQAQLAAAERMRYVETKVLLAENAASMGRFAAALSHELNSPVGALKSAIDTLNILATRREVLPEEKKARSREIEVTLLVNARESAGRLQEVVSRMQRSANLDRAETMPVDLNSLLKDVAYMLESQIKGRVNLELDLQPLPSLTVRPQQMSAVFASLLHNAIDGANGSGRVRMSTRRINAHVEVAVEDDGVGLPATELARIFEPGFKVKDERVTTGNWSLFSTRQIVREHGGEIAIESRPGEGTRVLVSLPA